jgi:hypothetical protein
MIALNGDAVTSKKNRVLLQFVQAQDTCRLLAAAVDLHADHASTALLRFGIDTLATGFWMAFVAPPEYFVGQGNIHIPSDLARIVGTLPPTAKDMLGSVLSRSLNGNPSKTLLKDVLNPATHGDALVNVQRIGSAPAAGSQWAAHIRDVMAAITHNFAVIVRDEAGIDVHQEMRRYLEHKP